MARVQRIPVGIAGLDAIHDHAVRLQLRIFADRDGVIRDAAIPLRGRLVPDERPEGLKPSDIGLAYYATDFDRVLLWDGAVWGDAPGQPARGMIVFFETGVTPPAWWLRCDGRTADGTQADGSMARVKAPTVPAFNGLLAYMRL